MANRAGPNDWLSADPVDDNGHVAYELNVNVVGGAGAPSDVTIVSPLGTQAIADAVAVTPATSSVWPASQSGSWTVTVAQATASSLNAQVVGGVASGAADSGNPVKVGGVYRASLPLPSDGQRVDMQMGARGRVLVGLGLIGTGATDGLANSDIVQAAGNDTGGGLGGALAVGPYVFNGTTWDRVRGDATDGMLTQSNAIGAVDDAAWDGSAASATVIAILKYCGQQLAAINANTAGP